jgi:hypothetical protein
MSLFGMKHINYDSSSEVFNFPFISAGRLLLHSAFVIATKLLRLIEMCVNETCRKVRISKHLSETFPI